MAASLPFCSCLTLILHNSSLYFACHRSSVFDVWKIKARRAGVSVTASNWVTDVKVRSSNEYQSSRHTAAPGQAPDVPGRGHVMQYHQPVDLSPEDFLPHPTDAGGVDSGPQLYQQPWGQLDGEIAGRLASFRPTPRMCHVPGFEKPGVVTDRPPADNE